MEFSDFKKKIERKFGLNLNGYKEKQLKRRIDSLMLSRGVTGYEAYYNMLVENKEQWQIFLDKVTINVSEFFRNPNIFNFLEREIIPELLKSKKRLKIWSAACSNGAEPYSVAMILNDLAPTANHTIEASDLDEGILKQAREGKYDEKSVKNVSKERLKKYFVQRNGLFEIVPKIKGKVVFYKHDLLKDSYGKNFDLILCRNVTIYFTPETQKKIYNGFFDSLNRGGILFIGATENILHYKELGFEKVASWFYRKL